MQEILEDLEWLGQTRETLWWTICGRMGKIEMISESKKLASKSNEVILSDSAGLRFVQDGGIEIHVCGEAIALYANEVAVLKRALKEEQSDSLEELRKRVDVEIKNWNKRTKGPSVENLVANSSMGALMWVQKEIEKLRQERGEETK